MVVKNSLRMSRSFILLLILVLLSCNVNCVRGIPNVFVRGLVGSKAYIDQESVSENEKESIPTQTDADYGELISDSPIIDPIPDSDKDNYTAMEEKSEEDCVLDSDEPTVDEIVFGESPSDPVELENPFTEESIIIKVINANKYQHNKSYTNPYAESSKCASLLNTNLSETKAPSHNLNISECVNLSDKLNEMVDETSRDSIRASYFESSKVHTNIQDISSKDIFINKKQYVYENNGNSKTKESVFETSDGKLLLKLTSGQNIDKLLEPTYATISIASTTPTTADTKVIQIKSNQATYLKEPTDNPIRTEQLSSRANQQITYSLNITDEKSIEIIPKPEKLFAYTLEEDDPGNRVFDKPKEPSVREESVTIPRPVSEDEDIRKLDLNGNYYRLKNYISSNRDKIEHDTLLEECSDCDVGILPITSLGQRSTPTTEEESLPTSNIIFTESPEGRELQIYSLGISDGIFLFSYITEFLSWIQPNDFPVELLRSALKNEMSWISLITESLRVEVGFVACLVAGVLLALAVPVVVLSHACYRMGGQTEDCSEDNRDWAGNCRRRTLVFILQLLLVLLCAGMVGMFVTNEQLSSAVVQSSEVLQTALSDVSTFIQNSHLQLHFLLTQSLDQTLQAVFADLDNVDTLLGRPIQKELVRETGLGVALESLSDLTKEAKSVTHQVERFMEEVRATQDLITSSRDKLSDLRQQVELFRRACDPRDRTMCDTIDASGLEVTFRLDQIKSDERLNRMRRMGGVGLELAVSEAKDHFLTVPSRVEADTRDAREDVRRLLTRQRGEIDEHTHSLERLARDLTSKVGEARFQAGYWTQNLDQLEYWRWIICLGGGVAVFMIWTMLLSSMCCGCCGSEKAAGPTILVTIVLLCLFSTALWTLVMIGLLVGGHTEVFLCRPLYDEPEFNVLSRLVDKPGVFYNEPSGGFIGNVIYGNNSIDVPVRNVLLDCRDSRPVYSALGLHRVMDVESAVGQGRWGDIKNNVRGIRANLSHFQVLGPVLTDQLGDLLATVSTNFTEHRIQMSRPVSGKDLDSFAKQLDNIGNQLRDLATASRIETLSSRTRRFIESHIRPLEGRKDALIYQLTALEVQTQPLQRQVNQSLSHLKTIQFFINSQGEAIAQRKSRYYVDRLLNYMEQLQDHVIRSAKETVAPCRPLWDIYNNSRLFFCRHTVDPLNGYWFATMWCLVVLLLATPVCLKLVDYYRVQGARSSGSPSENLMSSEQGGGWSTPGYDIKCSKGYH